MNCRHCGKPVMKPLFNVEYVEHVCCLRDPFMDHKHDHRAEPDLRINTKEEK